MFVWDHLKTFLDQIERLFIDLAYLGKSSNNFQGLKICLGFTTLVPSVNKSTNSTNTTTKTSTHEIHKLAGGFNPSEKY